MPNPVNQQTAHRRSQLDEPGDARRAGSSGFARSILLLDTITNGNAFRFAELQTLTELPKASLHRALADLIEQRLVVFDEQTMTYRSGFRLLEWANRIWSRNDLRKLAQDELDDLSARTGETVMLSVLADTHVIHLDCVESAQSVRTSVSVGHRIPAWCTAAGKPSTTKNTMSAFAVSRLPLSMAAASPWLPSVSRHPRSASKPPVSSSGRRGSVPVRTPSEPGCCRPDRQLPPKPGVTTWLESG